MLVLRSNLIGLTSIDEDITVVTCNENVQVYLIEGRNEVRVVRATSEIVCVQKMSHLRL